MHALWLLGFCLLLGQAAQRWLKVPDNTPAVLGWWVLNLAFPALVLSKVPKMQLDWSLGYAAFATWGTFLGAWALFAAIGPRLGWSRGRIAALTLTCGLGNTAYMGLAMIEGLRGHEALGAALIADQLGSFMALSTAGLWVAAHGGGGAVGASDMLRRIATFPPFLALVGGLAVRALGGWPPLADELLQRLGQTLVPLALFGVGLQFRLSKPEPGLGSALALGLGWKLIGAPALVMATGLAFAVREPALSVGVLQAAMAPMITAGILAQQWKLDDALSTRIVGWGIVLSLLSVPLWNVVLHQL